MPAATAAVASRAAANIIVVEAVAADAPLIAELTRLAWADKVAATSSGHRETATRVLEHLQSGGAFLLMKDEQPVGSVRWLPVAGFPQVWEILRMGVLPAQRGAHLSQHLLEAVIHRALASDVGELRLAVRADQEQLLNLYAAFGFERAPELEYTHANPLEALPIVMRRLLLRR